MIVDTQKLLEMLQDLDLALKTQATISNPDMPWVGSSVAELAANKIELLTQEIEELQRESMKIEINEVDVQKLNLQPGEILVVKVRSDELTEASMDGLRNGFRALLPNNKVVVLGTGTEGNIDLTVAKPAEYPEVNYCSDCSCGKKAAYEGT